MSEVLTAAHPLTIDRMRGLVWRIALVQRWVVYARAHLVRLNKHLGRPLFYKMPFVESYALPSRHS